LVAVGVSVGDGDGITGVVVSIEGLGDTVGWAVEVSGKAVGVVSGVGEEVGVGLGSGEAEGEGATLGSGLGLAVGVGATPL
jgi:hypothetical protein